MPPLRERVTDRAAIFTPEQRAALDDRLARFESETTHQIAVLTVPSLEGEPIEDFSMRVVEAWKLGRGDVDNGMLVLVAVGDRQTRIEVGYGLEGVVPDALASRVIREQMVPHFRGGRMDEGIEAGVRALMQAARGESVSPGPVREVDADPLLVAFFFGLVGAFLAWLVARRSRALRSGLGAILAGAGASLLVASIGIGVMAAVIAAVLGLMGFSGLPQGRHRWGGGPWVGLPRGGGFGGYRGGGGGFGGLGGGFGGGGATGRW